MRPLVLISSLLNMSSKRNLPTLISISSVLAQTAGRYAAGFRSQSFSMASQLLPLGERQRPYQYLVARYSSISQNSLTSASAQEYGWSWKETRVSVISSRCSDGSLANYLAEFSGTLVGFDDYVSKWDTKCWFPEPWLSHFLTMRNRYGVGKRDRVVRFDRGTVVFTTQRLTHS